MKPSAETVFKTIGVGKIYDTGTIKIDALRKVDLEDGGAVLQRTVQ